MIAHFIVIVHFITVHFILPGPVFIYPKQKYLQVSIFYICFIMYYSVYARRCYQRRNVIFFLFCNKMIDKGRITFICYIRRGHGRRISRLKARVFVHRITSANFSKIISPQGTVNSARPGSYFPLSTRGGLLQKFRTQGAENGYLH